MTNAPVINLTEFYKRTPLQKTTEFRLIPAEDTQRVLKEHKIEETDAYFAELGEKIRPAVDEAIRNISDKAFEKIKNDPDIDFGAYPDMKKKDKDAFYKKLMVHFNVAIKEMNIDGLKTTADIKSASFIQNALPMFVDSLDMAPEEKEDIYKAIKELKGKAEIPIRFLTTRITTMETWAPDRMFYNLEMYIKNATAIKKLLDSEIGDIIRATYPQIEDITKVDNYRNYITQKGIDEYNLIINGQQSEKGIETKGLKNIVVDNNNNKKKMHLPIPKEMYKQILYPKAKQYVVNKLESDADVCGALNDALPLLKAPAEKIVNELASASASDFVISFNSLHYLSVILFNDHNNIPNAIKEAELDELNDQIKLATKKSERTMINKKIDKVDKELNKKQYGFNEVFEICRLKGLTDNNDSELLGKWISYIKSLYLDAIAINEKVTKMVADGSINPIKGNEDNIDVLMEFFAAWASLKNALKTISRLNTEKGNNIMYFMVENNLDDLKVVIGPTERQIRGYIFRKNKEASVKNIAYFGKSSRVKTQWMQADGILSNQCMTIQQVDGKYYALFGAADFKETAIAGLGKTKLFAQKKIDKIEANLPRFAFSKETRTLFDTEPSCTEVTVTSNTTKPFVINREIYEICKNKTFSAGATYEEERKENLVKLIDFYKDFLAVWNESSNYSFTWAPSDTYKNLQDFQSAVSDQALMKRWLPANDEKIDRLVKDGKILKFQIVSADLCNPDKKNKDSNTDIFLAALSDDPDTILCSNPTLILRKATIKKPFVHKEGSMLVNKIDNDGKHIPGHIYKEIQSCVNGSAYITDISEEAREYIQRKKTGIRQAKKTYVKDERYTRDEYHITFTYIKNRTCHPEKGFNDKIRDNYKEMNVITLTRSMSDLIYCTITAPNGRLLESVSLNTVDGINFMQKLKDIDTQRKENKSIGKKYDDVVKNIRDDYVTRAVGWISKKVLQYNALVVCEWIDDEKRNRYSSHDFNVVYKLFEKVLISRLSDLHFTYMPDGAPGSATNPYQLCENSGNEFQDGIVFFVSPSYTTKLDPDTGFVSLFKTFNINNKSDKQLFLSNFDSITYNERTGLFEFKFDYNNFLTTAEIAKTSWTILAGGPTTKHSSEKKCYEYKPDNTIEVRQSISEAGHSLTDDFAARASEAELTTKEVDSFYKMFTDAIYATLNPHNGERKQYISPVTGKSYDYSENATLNLAKKFAYKQEEKLKSLNNSSSKPVNSSIPKTGKAIKLDWIDNIAKRP